MPKSKIVKDQIITIGLADDHKLFRVGVAKLLNAARDLRIVIEADSGEEMLEEMAKNGAPDIAIVDIKMGGMLGYELAKKITKKYPDTKIIALSMFEDETPILRMFRNGARAYMMKGCDPAELREAVRSVYLEGSYSNKSVSKALIEDLSNDSLVKLNDNEVRFLELCCSEKSYKEISIVMQKSHRTIDGYREKLFKRLNVNSRVSLALYAVQNGIYQLEM